MFNRLALVIVFLLLVTACGKAPRPFSDDLIGEAQHYFWSTYRPDTLVYSPDARGVQPLWDRAVVRAFSFGPGVVVPLSGASLTVRGVSGVSFTWLLMYQDASRAWHVERVLRMPGPAGEIRVEDRFGVFLRGYVSALPLRASRTFLRDQPSLAVTPLLPVSPLLVNPSGPSHASICIITDWYACSSIGGGPTQCQYVYSTEECTDDGTVDTTPSSGGPTFSDYTLVGLPSGSASAGGVAHASIKPDTSITNHPIVQCVYLHLMNPNLNHGLRSILSGFDDNQVYNVTFALSDTIASSDGRCSYLGNNNFVITLNASSALDTDYSRIYLAATFIHEAFHARLRQKALETFGSSVISAWPQPIDDMDLSELATYFEAESKSVNIWESVEHDWMVANIASLATSLEQFVQTYYKATYAAVGSDLAPYEALMYMGLQNSTLYQEEVVGKGLASEFTTYRGLLNEGGKCQN
ncbi:hypothetical protein [Dinghuibacter silviterrae]|uniref:Uncharacterized protein n=1 Tax=Dinghuibacter silviterrae TaxID=1539049 RepID=A0A4R8DI67_9BACT|nr:hypothetical protein [Dinghuibacter silviterrae]TDW96836.1 hypothetical protein EDB95_4672 [Dinghuibacter silviterrae]